jgi:hypothetical protein
MEPNRWLETFAPGFAQLSAQERKAIKDFSMLWSLFEGTILNTNASAGAVILAIGVLKGQGRLTLKPFGTAITYFSNRYYDGTNLTNEFNGLRLRPRDHKPLIEKVIKGQSTDDAEILSAMLIIVMRLRNNLFHGVKWSYGIHGQFKNFKNANNILMAVMALHGP